MHRGRYKLIFLIVSAPTTYVTSTPAAQAVQGAPDKIQDDEISSLTKVAMQAISSTFNFSRAKPLLYWVIV